MERKHYVLIGISVALALCPAIVPSLLPAAFIGALLGVGAVFWALRGVDKEDQDLKSEIQRIKDEIVKAKEEHAAALAHAEELDKFFKDNGYAELVENRRRIEMESAEFDKQVEAKRQEFEQEMEKQCVDYERDLAERNAQQEKVLQEKTALEMKLQKEIDNLTSRRDGAIEFVQKFDDAQKKYRALIEKFTRAKKNFEAVEYCLGCIWRTSQ